MANKKPKRGPEMRWFRDMGRTEITQMFGDKFFEGCRARRSAFITGAHRVSASVALDMVKWMASFGKTVTLHQIRPDLYGPQDKGPESVKQVV